MESAIPDEQLPPTETLPKYINVTKVLTYRVDEVVRLISEASECGTEDVTLEDVIEKIEEYVKEDFGCGWGHEANLKEFIFTNENGDEL